jgi:hypothetical protein
MEMTVRGFCIGLVIIWVTGTIFVVAKGPQGEAERTVPYHTTQYWRLMNINYGDFTAAAIDVIDTAGVCIYVAARSGSSIAITAIPKSQLPRGAGCQ